MTTRRRGPRGRASANGFVLWKASNRGKRMKRNQYIKQIGMDLIKSFIVERKAEYQSFSIDLKSRIDNFLAPVEEQHNLLQENAPSSQTGTRKRERCFLCGPKKDIQSQKCDKCSKYICKHHAQKNCNASSALIKGKIHNTP